MKDEIQIVARHVGKLMSKNSPTIFTGISVAGLITTTIFAVKATPKALQILDQEREYRKSRLKPDITKLDIVKLTWKCYVPTAVMGATSIACIISSNSINLRRNAALASVYSITEASLKEYQAKVVETIGENKERKVRDAIDKDKMEKNPVSKNEVIITGKGEALCYDAYSGRYFESDIEKIRRTENVVNKALMNENFISLNEVYYELGLANNEVGDEVGWNNYNEGLAFGFSSQLADNGTPCLVLTFIPHPGPDYLEY